MVPHELKPPNHLADSEEAKALGEDDARGNELSVAEAETATLRGLDGLGRGLEEVAGLTDGLPGGLVEGLEGGDGAVTCQSSCPRGGHQGLGRDIRRRHLLAAEDDLGNFYADLGVVYHEGDLLCTSESASIPRLIFAVRPALKRQR